MIGSTKLALAAIALLIITYPAHAQVPTLSKEMVKCREARILARQAKDLEQPLTELGLSQADAANYLKSFEQAVEACETNPGNKPSPAPRFPDQSPAAVISGGLGSRPTVATPSGLTAVPRFSFSSFLGPTVLAQLIESYHYTMAAQCGASLTFAQVAPSKAIFDPLIDNAAFGRCTQRGNRGTSRDQLPRIPSFSSSERQCHEQVMTALQKLSNDNCPNNPRASGEPVVTMPNIADLDNWKMRNPTDVTTTDMGNGRTHTMTTYEGLDDAGNKVKIVEGKITNAAGDVHFQDSDVFVTNSTTGTTTHIHRELHDGVKTAEVVSVRSNKYRFARRLNVPKVHFWKGFL
jgi:hypothetical protein